MGNRKRRPRGSEDAHQSPVDAVRDERAAAREQAPEGEAAAPAPVQAPDGISGDWS